MIIVERIIAFIGSMASILEYVGVKLAVLLAIIGTIISASGPAKKAVEEPSASSSTLAAPNPNELKCTDEILARNGSNRGAIEFFKLREECMRRMGIASSSP